MASTEPIQTVSCGIANFGLAQSSLNDWIKQENASKQVKKNDHLTEV